MIVDMKKKKREREAKTEIKGKFMKYIQSHSVKESATV